MTKLSNKTIEKVKQDMLYCLYESNLKPLYTKDISNIVARDKEFVLNLLKSFEKDRFVKRIKQKDSRKNKWMMSDAMFKVYEDNL